MHFCDFQAKIEADIRQVIRDAFPAAWDENHISFGLVTKLFSPKRLDVSGFDRPFRVAWDFRKLRRPEESDFGDIAVLVRLTTWASETVEGVGFFEAKRRELGKSLFPAVNGKQLRGIQSKAPSAQLLLYDYENVTAWSDNCRTVSEASWKPFIRRVPIEHTHCVCVPMGIANQCEKFNTNLHKFGVPLSYQLCARYFRGFDLETSPKIIEAVKGNIKKHGGPRAIVLVGVSTGSQDPQVPEVDESMYVRD